MKRKTKNRECPLGICDGSGIIEVDPRGPNEAGTQQTEVCECVKQEADYLESVAYDDYEE